MHEKAALLLAEDLTGTEKVEKTCLLALSMCAFPNWPSIEISICNKAEEEDQGACLSHTKGSTTPVATGTVILDSDVPEIISIIQSCPHGINKLVEVLQHKFSSISKSKLRNKVREMADFSENRWQVKKEILVKFGSPKSPEKVSARRKNIATFFSKRCLPPSGKTINPNETSPQATTIAATCSCHRATARLYFMNINKHFRIGSATAEMGIDEAGRGPVLGPMVYGCLYCARSYQETLSTLSFADSKTLKEEKREELFESLKVDESIGWAVDVIDPRELSAKMLKKDKINLNEISHESAMGLVSRVLNLGVLLTEIYVDTMGDPEKYRVKLSDRFPSIKFVVAKNTDSLYPVVSGASIVAKVSRDRAVRDWVLDETAENMHRNFGSGYPGDPATKAWLEHHKHTVFGFPTLVRFSWGTCLSYAEDNVEVLWESYPNDEDGSNGNTKKRQLKLTNIGFTTAKKKSEDIESSGNGRCKFFQARKLELVSHF